MSELLNWGSRYFPPVRCSVWFGVCVPPAAGTLTNGLPTTSRSNAAWAANSRRRLEPVTDEAGVWADDVLALSQSDAVNGLGGRGVQVAALVGLLSAASQTALDAILRAHASSVPDGRRCFRRGRG